MRNITTIVCVGAMWLGAGQAFCRADTFAVVVGGICKDATERATQDKTLADLQSYLMARTKNTRGAATAPEVKDALSDSAAAMGPQDRFIFWYVGQANAVGGKLRLNLLGPDITQEDLAAQLTRIKAGTVLIVLDCPKAALAVQALSGPGRVILCASTQEQAYGTQFSRYFVPALAAAENDADKDGKVSVLEAFAAAARQIEQWYQSKRMLPTETPCLDDNGDGKVSERPWRRADSIEGAFASGLFLNL
jgi:hypothetical protein